MASPGGPGGSGLPLLDIWIEFETPAGTPTFGVLGDSIPGGVGNNYPVQESWPSQYAYDTQALSVYFGGSGESLANSLDVNMEKWTRWAHTARLDGVVIQVSNDIFTGSSLAAIQANLATVIDALRAYVSDNIFLGTISPRTGVTGAMEDVRRAYNAWIKTLPLGARDVYDFSAAVSADDETLIPAFDADGTHWTTAGSTSGKGAVTRPITTPPLMYATL